jgi:hypothetical protein
MPPKKVPEMPPSMDDFQNVAQYVESLTPSLLKKFIANLNKAIRKDLVIVVKGKSHQELKEELLSKIKFSSKDDYSFIKGRMAVFKTVAIKKMFDPEDLTPTPSQNLKKPTKTQMNMERKKEQAETKKQLKAEEAAVVKEAKKTLARVSKKLMK